MKPAAFPALRAARLLDQVRERIRYKHYSLRTEQAFYVLDLIYARLKPPGRTMTLTRGQFRGVSEAKLLELVATLGRDVKIVRGPVRSRLRLGPPTTRPALPR